MIGKEILEKPIADIQSDIGKFLEMKKVILEMPSTMRGNLLTKQNELESKALRELARASSLKDRLPSNIMEALKLSSVMEAKALMTEAVEVAQGLAGLKKEMDLHRAAVSQAQGNAPTTTPGAGGLDTYGGWAIAGIGLLILWFRGRGR